MRVLPVRRKQMVEPTPEKSEPEMSAQEEGKGRGLSRRTFEHTDVGNAKRLVDWHGRDLRYCHDLKKWLVWGGKRWAVDNSGEIKRRAMMTAREIRDEASQIDDQEKNEATFKHALFSESLRAINAMIDLAKCRSGIPISPKELDSGPWLLNCQNGVLDLRSGEIIPHQRDLLITKIVPVDYDRGAECPKWKEFLNRIMDGNSALIEFLQRCVGYSLTGDTSEQCLFLLYGRGANGKSTFLEVIRRLLAEYAKQSDFDSFVTKKYGSKGIRNDLARLKGARFVSAVEAERGETLHATVVKQVTGRDTLLARFLYQEYFEFVAEFKLFLAANHRPYIDPSDRALVRRINVIPFSVAIPEDEQDRHLLEKLEEELPGILAWAVSGCHRWQKHGLSLPDEAKNALDSYLKEIDVTGQFIEERCELLSGAEEQAGSLYAAYAEWCKEVGEDAITKKRFGMELRDRGFDPIRRNSGRGYSGIRLKG